MQPFGGVVHPNSLPISSHLPPSLSLSLSLSLSKARDNNGKKQNAPTRPYFSAHRRMENNWILFMWFHRILCTIQSLIRTLFFLSNKGN